MATLWPFSPNLRSADYAVHREYRTDMIVSRAGREQRRALRQTPRKRVEFVSSQSGDCLRDLNDLMVTAQRLQLAIADRPRFTILTLGIGAASNTAFVAPLPSWIIVGAELVLVDKARQAIRTVNAIVSGPSGGWTVTFDEIDTVAWPVGTRLHASLNGYLNERLVASRTSPRGILETRIVYHVDPGVEAAEAVNDKENWIERTDDPGSASWTAVGTPIVVTGLADPFGGMRAFSIEDDNPAAFELSVSSNDDLLDGVRVNGSCYVKRDPAATAFILMRMNLDATLDRVDFKYNPVDDAVNVTAIGDATLHGSGIEIIDSDWRRIWADVEYSVGDLNRMSLYPAAGIPGSFPAFSSAAVGTNIYSGPQITTINPVVPHEFVENLTTNVPADGLPRFKGRELWLTEPVRWLPVAKRFLQEGAAEIDYGFGTVQRFFPVPFTSRLWQATYSGCDYATSDAFRQFFDRLKGRLGEFFMPTFNADLVPTVALTTAGTTMVVDGSNIATVYDGSVVFTALAVRLKTGTWLARKIDSIVAGSGDVSTITLASTWGQEIALADIDKVCWLPMWRFATDILTTVWRRDNLATVSMSLQMIEYLPTDGGSGTATIHIDMSADPTIVSVDGGSGTATIDVDIAGDGTIETDLFQGAGTAALTAGMSGDADRIVGSASATAAITVDASADATFKGNHPGSGTASLVVGMSADATVPATTFYAAVDFQLGTGTGNLDIDTADLNGETPKAVALYLTNGEATETPFAGTGEQGFLATGFADGTFEGATSAVSRQGTNSDRSAYATDKILWVLHDDNTTDLLEATFVNFHADGVRISIDTIATELQSKRGIAVFFTGPNTTVKAGVVDAVSSGGVTTDLGFATDFVLFADALVTAPDKAGSAVTKRADMGFALNDGGSPPPNYKVSEIVASGGGNGRISATECGGASQPIKATFSGDDMTLTDSGNTLIDVLYLAVTFGGDVTVKTWDLVSPTTVGTVTESGLGITPDFLFYMMGPDGADFDTDYAGKGLGMGCCTSSFHASVCTYAKTGLISTTRLYSMGEVEIADLDSFASGEFTFDFTTVSSIAVRYAGLAFG